MKKLKLVSLLILSLTITGCIKLMADESDKFISYHQREIGSSARDLLTDDWFTSLVLDIQYMPGHKPQDEAIKDLKKFLQRYVHKPNGIQITLQEIPSSPDSVLSVAGVKAIEDKHRISFTNEKELVIYLLFTDGYAADQDALGYAYRNTSAVLFGKNIAKHSNKFKKPSRDDLEHRVMMHEFGHLFGLVNVGAEQQQDHQDHNNGKHCKNKSCLMYHLTDTDDYPSFLLKKLPPTFDKDCLADLRALGSK